VSTLLGAIMSLPSLTTHNHTSFIASHALVLVLYASPWCAHRQRLLPTLAMAAASLPDTVAIALCEEPALAEAAGVVEMPSLRLHRPDDDDVPEPFDQDTPEDDEAGALADYLLRSSRTTPPRFTSREALLHELSSAERLGGVTAVLFGAELDGVAAEAASLRQVARQAHGRGKVGFALADASLAHHFGGEVPYEAPCLAVFRGAGAAAELHVPTAELPSLREPDQLRLLLSGHAQPLLAQIGPHNYAEYADTGRPLFYLFLNSSCCAAANRQAKRAAAAAAAVHRGALSFVWLDGEHYSHHARALGAAAEALPVIAAEAHEAHYVYDGPVGEAEAVGAWAGAVLAGKLRPTLRSATPPLLNGGPVMVTVAATFESLVLRAAMPVLLYVHAPWCGACDATAAEVEALATSWQADPTLHELYTNSTLLYTALTLDSHCSEHSISIHGTHYTHDSPLTACHSRLVTHYLLDLSPTTHY
jgi:protein disulfide-isomerase A1